MIETETDIDTCIANIAKHVNNKLREHFGEIPSDINIPTIVIKQTRGSRLDPKRSHQKWREARIADGWTGGDYDFEKKTHPNLAVPSYEELPFEQKIKDYVFWGVVQAIDLFYLNMREEDADISEEKPKSEA